MVTDLIVASLSAHNLYSHISVLSVLHGTAKVTELDEDSAKLLLDLMLEEDLTELLVMAASEPPSPCFLLDEDPSSQSLHKL